MDIDKESVELTSVHLIEGCGKNLSGKLPHFQSRTSEKHFHKYVMPDGSAK